MKTKNRNLGAIEFIIAVAIAAAFAYVVRGSFLALDNDNYWQLAHGHNMLQNGLYTDEPLTMHEGLKFIYPQWLAVLIFTKIYDIAGVFGVDVWYRFIQLVGVYFLYKLVKMQTDNDFVSTVLAYLFFIVYSTSSYATRPFVISQTLIAVELYILEKFIRTKNEKILFWLPVISVIWINVHNSLWLFLYILILPMVAEYLFCMWKKIERPFKMTPLVVSCAVSEVVALANPYGIDYILYLPNSSGAVTASWDYIVELKPGTIAGVGAITLCVFTAFWLCVLKSYKQRVEGGKEELTRDYPPVVAPIRYWLLLAGTFVLAMMHVRNITIFYMGSAMLIAYYTEQFVAKPKDDSLGHIFKKSLIVFWLIFAAMCFMKSRVYGNEAVPEEEDTAAIEFMEENVSKDSNVFAAMNSGGILELYGYKPFIDTRLEVFMESLNGEHDYLTDYWKLQIGTLWPGDFFKDYNFDVFYMKKDNLPIVENYLTNTDGYDVIYEDDNVTIYETDS